MTAYNVVRFKVKRGREKDFVTIHRDQSSRDMKGLLGGALVKTGDRNYCFIGEWDSFDAIVNARPQMLGNLELMRPLLEDLGSGLGVTDPISGEAVVEF